MKLNIVLLSILVLATAAARASQNKMIEGVYGEDNRVEAYQRPELRVQANAVAAMITNKAFTLETMIGYQIDAPTQEFTFDLCSTEKFAFQPILAECSGFLVAKDVIMTAGHCIRGMNDCKNFKWAFGYEMSRKGNPTELDRNNVYECKSIIARAKSDYLDYAIIKLDRATDRTPLKLGSSTEMAPIGTNVVLMGYPSGLPLKIADNAQIISWEKTLLITNLDAFHVNSGSPVLDAKTNNVVGILVAGAEDYKRKGQNGCWLYNVMDMKKGNEALTSVKIIPRNF